MNAPSIDLLHNADIVLAWGIASVVLGWTVIVPLVGFFMYLHVANMAKTEGVMIPGKATTGLALSLIFGVIQLAAMVKFFG